MRVQARLHRRFSLLFQFSVRHEAVISFAFSQEFIGDFFIDILTLALTIRTVRTYIFESDWINTLIPIEAQPNHVIHHSTE
ncbi:hypothetical protein D3C87_1651120 [compost metagenome]